MSKPACVGLLLLIVIVSAAGQEFELPEAKLGNAAELSNQIAALAKQVIAAYKEEDRDKYLDNLFRLQTIAGHYDEANNTIESLRELRRPANRARAA